MPFAIVVNTWTRIGGTNYKSILELELDLCHSEDCQVLNDDDKCRKCRDLRQFVEQMCLTCYKNKFYSMLDPNEAVERLTELKYQTIRFSR